MGFKDINTAADLRRVIEKIASNVVDKKRPALRVGRVYSFNIFEQKAQVLFPGNTVDSLVPVKFALDKVPTLAMVDNFSTDGYEAYADVVRVAGKPGDWFILDYLIGSPRSVMSSVDPSRDQWTDVLGYQDYAQASGPGDVTINLTFKPIPNTTVQVKWWGVDLEDDQWEFIDEWTILVHDPSGVVHADDRFMAKYLYNSTEKKTPLLFSELTWSGRNGNWTALPSSFINSWPLPTDTQVGDMLVIVAAGQGDNAIGDSRVETIINSGGLRISVGYATDLTDITCHVGGVSSPFTQFAGIEILAARGSEGEGLSYDPDRIASAIVPSPSALPTIGGTGHGSVMAVVAGWSSGISLDWATFVPDYEDLGGDAHTSILGNFGYCSADGAPAQSNPTNSGAAVAVIGLK